jgi:hypothetical protein
MDESSEPRVKTFDKVHWATTTGASLVGSTAGYAVGGLPGALIGGSTGGVVEIAYQLLARWRIPHIKRVLEEAASTADLSTEDLLKRLSSSELHGELAARVLIAAQDAGTEERLRALSRSLANGAIANDAQTLRAEILYARALGDLDAPHVHTLTLFRRTWKELGLSQEDTLPPDGLNYTQLAMCARLGDLLDPALGVLVQHGLLDERNPEGQSFGISRPMGIARVMQRGTFNLTAFGRSLLDRMVVLGHAEENIPMSEPGRKPEVYGCLVCLAPATHRIPRSSPFRQRPDSDDPTRVILNPYPPMPLCDSHLKALGSERLAVGWCEVCGRWGEVNRNSDCGAPFTAL